MLHKLRQFILLTAMIAPVAAWAQVPVKATTDQTSLLASSNPQIAANKRLVYDFWREVLEAGHMDLADKYLTESYIQHNPTVPTGRAGFVDLFSKFSKPKPIEAKIQSPLVSITAEGNFVILSFVSEALDPNDKTKTYTTTWFDMFRIENHKIAEHWDPTVKEAAKPAVTDARPTIQLDPATLNQYVGKYAVTEISPPVGDIPKDMAIEVSIKGDQLMLEITGKDVQSDGAKPLTAKAIDDFITPAGSQVNFKHGDKGRVNLAVLQASGHVFTGVKPTSGS
jgi:predicted SnoaL-like aldol condensation-catalyzing enzyme